MKTDRKAGPWRASIVALFLVGLSAALQAQPTNFIVDQFDEDTSALFGSLGWGTTVPFWRGTAR